MNKNIVPEICSCIGIVLAVAFVVKSCIDYSNYSAIYSSAPFSVWIMVNALYCLIPAAVFFIGFLIRRRKKETSGSTFPQRDE